MGDYDEFLIIQVRKEFLEPYLPCGIGGILFGWHGWGERLETVGESVREPLLPIRPLGIWIVFGVDQVLEIDFFVLKGFSSVDEDDLVFWGGDHKNEW